MDGSQVLILLGYKRQQMKISYAITVHNEHVEIERLLSFLTSHIDDIDEIVVQCDLEKTTPEVLSVLDTFESSILKIFYPLALDFGEFKTNLKNHCTGDWIFQIDADEIPHESLIANLKEVLHNNTSIGLIQVPRVNTVEGLTQSHITQWNWNVDENGWVNWPDYQPRIIQNTPTVHWVNRVHELVTGIDSMSNLPAEEQWALYHPKTIDRQEQQNKFYNTI